MNKYGAQAMAHQLVATPREVDAVAGTERQTKLQDPTTHGFHVSEVPCCKAVESRQDPQAALAILEPTQPVIELLGRENLDHMSILVDSWPFQKG